MNQKLKFVLVGLWISVHAWAQETAAVAPTTIATMQAAEKIRDEVCSGYSIKIAGEFNEVHDAFIKNLKTYGKVKEDRRRISVSNPSINGTMHQEKSMYALAKKGAPENYLWVGINMQEWEQASIDLINPQMEQVLKNFVLAYYRGRAQKKIDETQKAWNSIEKLQSKTVKQSSDLSRRLENNVKEKARLQQAIVDNDNENVSLKARLVSNKKAQDSIAKVLEQVKKKMAVHQEELRKIN